jgi:hypothetical protein
MATWRLREELNRMATVHERYGRKLSTERAEVLYLVKEAGSEAAAYAAVEANSSDTSGGLVREDIEIEELEGLEGVYLGTVRYAALQFQPPETGSSSFSFDTSGGTQHITQSILTTNRYAPAGATAPDFQGAIGVTVDSVEGVDITVPIYAFTETHYLSSSVVTNAYKGTLFNLTGRVNNAAFKGLAEGECLFLGATGSLRSVTDDWEITYRFAASPNATGLTVGSITGINKKGWEYLWVRYQDVEDSNVLVKQPIAAYVEQVYPLLWGSGCKRWLIPSAKFDPARSSPCPRRRTTRSSTRRGRTERPACTENRRLRSARAV